MATANVTESMTQPAQLVEHYFRHEYGRVVSILCHRFGQQHLDAIEDSVQSALQRAMKTWPRHGIPADPAGWIFLAARNVLVDLLRRDKTWQQIHQNLSQQQSQSEDTVEATSYTGEQLKMLFACCHPSIPIESQIALALKTLCGFSIREIAHSLLTTEANIHKRLQRAKVKLREEAISVEEELNLQQQAERLSAVQLILYLLFNEGYNSQHSDELIRHDLCEEAMRLVVLLLQSPAHAVPSTAALYALMLLHIARFAARLSSAGELLLLEEQDRTLWDQAAIRAGFAWLNRAATGEELSKYHLEAALAAEHCRAASFSETNWNRIEELYSLLHTLEPSSIHALNQAIAKAYLHGPRSAIHWLHSSHSSGPDQYHLWPAVLGELHRRTGETETARKYFEEALTLCTSSAEQALLRKRLGMLE